jgi:hypothetical protein
LVTLGFLLFSGPKNGPIPPHGGRPKPKEIIVEKLHFDTNQQADYEQLIQQHRKEITTTEDHIKNAKNQLYLLLNDETVDVAKKDSLISLLSTYQKEIETIHFNHFRDIKKLCKPEQLNDFIELTEELSHLFSKPHRTRNE